MALLWVEFVDNNKVGTPLIIQIFLINFIVMHYLIDLIQFIVESYLGLSGVGNSIWTEDGVLVMVDVMWEVPFVLFH